MKEKIIELQKLKIKQFCAFSPENNDTLVSVLDECRSFIKGELIELSSEFLFIKEYLILNLSDLILKEDVTTEIILSKIEEDFKTVYETEYDKYIRLYADFENFKKRYYADIKSIKESTKYDTLSSMLDLVSDFDRAKKIISNSTDSSLKEGLELIIKKFTAFLEQQGVTEVENTVFDPELHEAISVLKVEGVEKGSIVDVLEKGYRMNNTVVRHSKVIVCE